MRYFIFASCPRSCPGSGEFHLGAALHLASSSRNISTCSLSFISLHSGLSICALLACLCWRTLPSSSPSPFDAQALPWSCPALAPLELQASPAGCLYASMRNGLELLLQLGLFLSSSLLLLHSRGSVINRAYFIYILLRFLNVLYPY